MWEKFRGRLKFRSSLPVVVVMINIEARIEANYYTSKLECKSDRKSPEWRIERMNYLDDQN